MSDSDTLGIYVVVIGGEVACLVQMDDQTRIEVQDQIDEEPFQTGMVVGPVTVITQPLAIKDEVERVLDSWR
jgi:hypothetical protein